MTHNIVPRDFLLHSVFKQRGRQRYGHGGGRGVYTTVIMVLWWAHTAWLLTYLGESVNCTKLCMGVDSMREK